MRVLILDDEKSRHDRFRRWLRICDVRPDLVYAAPQCCRALSTLEWNYVFLDHDLELSLGRSSMHHGSGTDVVHHIRDGRGLAQGLITAGTKFIVHSINPNRSAYMVAVLTELGIPVCRRAYAWHDRFDLAGLASRGWPMELERWETWGPQSEPTLVPAARRAMLLAAALPPQLLQDWDCGP
jgi:hypothetical protein